MYTRKRLLQVILPHKLSEIEDEFQRFSGYQSSADMIQASDYLTSLLRFLDKVKTNYTKMIPTLLDTENTFISLIPSP